MLRAGLLLATEMEIRAATARDAGARDVYLLTTTAEDYFPRFGFARTTREAVPPALKSSAEFTSACPESAAVMLLSLADATGRMD